MRLQPAEADLIDRVRGPLARAAWMREAALSVARQGDVPPTTAEGGGDVLVNVRLDTPEAQAIRAACQQASRERGGSCTPGVYVRDAALWVAGYYESQPAWPRMR
jgi:hypothetical protein